MNKRTFEKELRTLQEGLCQMQDWVVREGARVAIVFEGRDTAGKGGVIKRIKERVSPRVFRVVALPAPTDREKSQLYLQRYVEHLPAAGEVVIFDRSWYNRAGVERVMNFCDEEQYQRFMRVCPRFEELLVRDGIILIKYFLDVDAKEQGKRLRARVSDPCKHWKLSPMDIASWSKWDEYTDAYNDMIEGTDTEIAPWYRVPANDKRLARLNCISHLLETVPYKAKKFDPPEFPKRTVSKEKVSFRRTVPERFG